jgi:hypothetical protein
MKTKEVVQYILIVSLLIVTVVIKRRIIMVAETTVKDEVSLREIDTTVRTTMRSKVLHTVKELVLDDLIGISEAYDIDSGYKQEIDDKIESVTSKIMNILILDPDVVIKRGV